MFLENYPVLKLFLMYRFLAYIEKNQPILTFLKGLKETYNHNNSHNYSYKTKRKKKAVVSRLVV